MNKEIYGTEQKGKAIPEHRLGPNNQFSWITGSLTNLILKN
jgi:hypothetical protein